jgi:hypothetical protein
LKRATWRIQAGFLRAEFTAHAREKAHRISLKGVGIAGKVVTRGATNARLCAGKNCRARTARNPASRSNKPADVADI